MIRIALASLAIRAILSAQAPPVVANGTAEPSQIRIGVASKVRFYADIGDPNLVAGSVNLQRIGAANTNPVVVGTLKDDGTGGDEIAGDGRYSIEITLTEPVGNVTFVISAAIRNQIIRPKSANIIVSVMANRPPVALAGPAQSVRTNTAVKLDGRNSYDLDADLISFSWSLTRPAGSAAALDNSTFVKPGFTPDVVGTYRATLLVSDGSLTSAASEVVITASATNAAPTALITGTILLPFGAGATTNVPLSGATSFDPENAPLTYLWRLVSKPASSTAPTFASLTSATPTLAADKPGRYVIELIVNDGTNPSVPVQTTVILYKPNTPPAVNAGPDQTVTSAAPVSLAGSATDADPGDTISSFAWAFISRPAGSTATLTGPSTASPSFTPDLNGDFLLELTATDSRGVTARARVVVRRPPPVNAPVNVAPTVSAGSPQTITLPAVAALLASASDDGLPNPPAALSITWIVVSGPAVVTFSSPGSLATNATFYQPGSYVLRVTANDSALATSSQVTVTVNSTGPVLPPISDRTIPLGTSFRLRLVASSNDPATALTFTLPAAPTGALLNPNPTIDWTPTSSQVGLNTFTARVQDSQGRFDTKTFRVTVTNANRPPVLAAQADASIAVGNLFTRTLVGTDPDAGDTLTYALVSGPAGMTVGGANLSWTAAGPAYIPNLVLVKVTDQAGAFDVKKFNITLLPSPPPVATDDSYTVKIGSPFTLAAPGVLSNDANPSGNPVTATKLTNPSIGTVSAFNPDGSFTYLPPAALPGKVFQPILSSFFEGSAVSGTNPLVADLDKDGKAEIIHGIASSQFGAIESVHENGTLHWRVPHTFPAPWSDCVKGSGSQYELAIGDIDDDGFPEVITIVGCARDGYNPRMRVAALNGSDGSLKWMSPPISAVNAPPGSNPDMLRYATPTIGRLRAGESPSILLALSLNGTSAIGVDSANAPISGPTCRHIVATTDFGICSGVIVLNGTDGSVRQRMIAVRGQGFFDRYYGGVTAGIAPIVVDLDNDGIPEIVAGAIVFRNNGTVLREQTTNYTTAAIAVGNFDDTPDVEIVRLEAQGNNGVRLAVFKTDGSILWQLPFEAGSGFLTVADVDSSGHPTIILNANQYVFAFDYQGKLRWIYDASVGGIQKLSSRASHAVFDLDGDGISEVIISAMERLIFLDGATGTVKHIFDVASIPSSGGVSTVNEAYEQPGPVISDTAGTGKARIVFTYVGNLLGAPSRIAILKNINDDWQPVRQIMNQNAYFGANVNNNATIPALPLPNNFASSATNISGPGAQPRIAAAVDPRVRYRTSFTYKDTSGGLDSNAATVSLDIAPSNRPPVFTSTPPTRFLINSPLTFTVAATDPDPGDTVTYSIVFLPYTYGDCSIHPTSGVFTCTQVQFGNNGVYLFGIAATDSFGARTIQSVSVTGVTTALNVPAVVGLTQSAATSAIVSASFRLGAVKFFASSSAAGTVLAQSLTAGSFALTGELIAITVSSGPAPAAIPFVTGQALTAANTILTTVGFSSAVTRVFSNLVPANVVISQSPAAGTLLSPTPTNPVALVVSSGNGLSLSLNRSIVTADQNTTVTPMASDVNGNPAALPSLTYAITAALTPFAGPMPTIAGTTITAGMGTVGVFTVTATDSVNARSASINFTVITPRVAGEVTHGESYAQMLEALESIFALKPQLVAARDANNTTLMRTLLQQMVTTWRTVNLDDLKISIPLVPADKFAPTITDLAGFGLSATPSDLVINQIVRDANSDLKALTEGLKALGTTMPQLNTLIDQFSIRAARLDGLVVSEYGGIYNQHDYTLLLSHRIPAFYEALFEEIAQATGLPRRTGAFPAFTLAKTSGKGEVEQPLPEPTPDSTLAEVAVTIVTNLVIDKIMENANALYTNAKKFAVQTYAQATWTAAAVGLNTHLKEFAYGKDIIEVVSGASISFRVFNEPVNQAMIEVETDPRDPELNIVIIIGPQIFIDAFNGIEQVVKKIKDLASYAKNPATNPLRATNLNQFKSRMSELILKVKASGNAALAVKDTFYSIYQSPTDVLPGCIFDSSPTCSELVYDNGINPVYRYTPPPGFGGSGLPVGINFIVQNATGDMYFGVKAFFPALEKP